MAEGMYRAGRIRRIGIARGQHDPRSSKRNETLAFIQDARSAGRSGVVARAASHHDIAVRMAGRPLDEATLRLTITPEGSVSDVVLSGPGASLPLRACLTAKARDWVFPRPGGSLPVQTQMRLAITPH